MSARALTWCWTVRPRTAAQKLVLAALADRADDDGECFPSIRWLAAKCAPMSERSVREALRELAVQGLVEKTNRRRRGDGTLGTWLFRLPLELTPDQCQPSDSGSDVDQRQPDDSGPVTPGRQTSDTRSTRRDVHRDDQTSTDVEVAEAPVQRQPDVVWDSLVELFGSVVEKTNAHGKRNKAVKDLKALGATPETIASAVRQWPRMFEDATLTDVALATHYPQLAQQAGGGSVVGLRDAVLSWARNVGRQLEEPGLDEELMSWASRGADDDTLREAKRIATSPIEKLAAGLQ